jgi:TetR/AcrR family transcriptional regulator, tetracycline repressor protein
VRWKEQLKEVARTMRATLLAHRDIGRLSIGRIPVGPNALQYADRVVGILRAGGIPGPLAVVAHQLLISIVLGFGIDETGEGGAPPADQPPPEAAGAMLHEYMASLPGDRFPQLSAVAEHYGASDADARFELLLDIYVDGLAKRARPRRRSR